MLTKNVFNSFPLKDTDEFLSDLAKPSSVYRQISNIMEGAENMGCSKPVECAIYSDEAEAIKRRQECDYSQKITFEMAKSGNVPRPVRVYADGVFDLFHYGHARQLQQAKNAFPCQVYLIAGVTSEEEALRCKGPVVNSETERVEAIRHCRYVDEVVRGVTYETKMQFVKDMKIDFVAHDDVPGTMIPGHTDDYKKFKDVGMFLETQRTTGVSSTEILAKILTYYDVFVKRNMDRGYTAKDLNIDAETQEKILKINSASHVRNGVPQVPSPVSNGVH